MPLANVMQNFLVCTQLSDGLFGDMIGPGYKWSLKMGLVFDYTKPALVQTRMNPINTKSNNCTVSFIIEVLRRNFSTRLHKHRSQ